MAKAIFSLITISFVLRAAFFSYGVYQDSHFSVKYTDIDYYVFHDAARHVFENSSPYARDTYRYTPLLCWLLLPNHWLNWIHFGKLLFVIFDILTGVLILALLKRCTPRTRLILASVWLLNPMVITISTRGNSESLLSFAIMLALFLLEKQQYALAGLAYGLSIHLKIYPIIYSVPISIYVFNTGGKYWLLRLVTMGGLTISVLVSLGLLMYHYYGDEFVQHTYIYHFIRTDHRHNFSVWNILLYLDSSLKERTSIDWAKYAFAPQIIISLSVCYLLWEYTSWENLLNVLFLQTLSFVTYNKVCTSQYFIWYLIFLPFYLKDTMLTWKTGVFMGIIWTGTQALWLYNGYELEFKGQNVFYPGIFFSSIAFFLSNIYLLSIFITDCKKRGALVTLKKNI
ncbi:HHL006Cp [Eremothecium sinecaudum]|uniref:GPI mannosyltransferase 1 n=1 Tax=Eremothecium sinecaudum TaxID=45286 RepID=A0A0X8HWK4_9SACH|nr:HHL006Cp [Eremothecium sinecaudum]AMD22764.1 HHL006Cp [Eremothecium sinecaudum]